MADKQQNTTTAAAEKNTELPKQLDFSYTQNRELSWLRFNDRVLDESLDVKVPLFERLKFVAIFGSNLDEWFMIRIGGLSDLTLLKHQPKDNKSNQTPAEQLQDIFAVLPHYVAKHERALNEIEHELSASYALALKT